VVKPIKDAFRDIFPKKTGQDLYNLTVRFRDFMKSLTLSDSTAANLKRTFRGVFALFDIGKQVVSGIFGVLKDLIGVVAGGSGGFLNFTGNIGDMLVAFDQALKKGGGLVTFFHGLSGVLQVPLASSRCCKGRYIRAIRRPWKLAFFASWRRSYCNG
jgi:hypothetical protein